MTTELRPDEANAVISSLRNGQPPRRFVSSYSVGTEGFMGEVREEHLESGAMFGSIRFISGSWGSGKTHFLRLLREAAFNANHLVAAVDLDRDEAPFNKFEKVFFRIVQEITSPEMYRENDLDQIDPIGEVLRRGLFALAGENPSGDAVVTAGGLREAQEALYGAKNLDQDFRKIIDGYWRTFGPDSGDPVSKAQRRDLALSWFKGEGTLTPYRQAFNVLKMVDRGNARVMLQSLSRLARLLGYAGFVLLLDEGELTTSMLRRSDVRVAHNNLRHLIDSIQDNDGLFAVYAATPDFFLHPEYGVVAYGALAQRTGRPEDRIPKALDRIWNLDALKTAPEDYEAAAVRLRGIYAQWRPTRADRLISEAALVGQVRQLVRSHPEHSQMSTWRAVMQSAVESLDHSITTAEPSSH